MLICAYNHLWVNSYSILSICFQTVKCFQVLLFTTNYSIQHYSIYIVTWPQELQCKINNSIFHPVEWFLTFYTDTFICSLLSGSSIAMYP